MRFTSLFLLLAVVAAPAAQAKTRIYHDRHEVAETDFTGDRRGCRQNNGKYNGRYCYMPAVDSLKIEQRGSEFKVEAETFGTDFDQCNFTGVGKLVAVNKLLVTDAEAGCSAEVTFRGNYAAFAVVEGGNCEDSCGMHASLYIERAKRVK